MKFKIENIERSVRVKGRRRGRLRSRVASRPRSLRATLRAVATQPHFRVQVRCGNDGFLVGLGATRAEAEGFCRKLLNVTPQRWKEAKDEYLKAERELKVLEAKVHLKILRARRRHAATELARLDRKLQKG